MPSPSYFSRRAANKQLAESSGATPVPMTTGGLARMMEAIKQQSREFLSVMTAPIAAATAGNTLAGGAIGAGILGEAHQAAMAGLVRGLPAALNGVAFGAVASVLSGGALVAVVGTTAALLTVMRDSQESMKATVAEARENAQQRLQQDDGAAYSPRPS